MFVTLLIVSSMGGLLSGLLGVGGAVVLIPLLYSVPPFVGVGQVSMHVVSGITMVQVLATSLLGYIVHGSGGHVHRRTVLSIGIPMGVCALLGSMLSRYMHGQTMLSIFGCLVIAAFLMLLRPARDESEEDPGPLSCSLLGSLIVGGSVGFTSGIVGAGGGFIVIPLMVRVLGMPMRVAVGSSLGVVFIGAALGALGKVVTWQMEWTYLVPVLLGSIPAALLGARLSQKLRPAYLRYLLIVVVFLAAANTWREILGTP